jgi:hypothetical protein
VIPTKVAARALGSEVAISGNSSTTLKFDPLSQDSFSRELYYGSML